MQGHKVAMRNEKQQTPLHVACVHNETNIAKYLIESHHHLDVDAHRAWMLRSYALTLAAVTLRIYIPLSQVAGVEFEAAYQAISWFCWVPNLLIVEWIVLTRNRRPTAAT